MYGKRGVSKKAAVLMGTAFIKGGKTHGKAEAYRGVRCISVGSNGLESRSFGGETGEFGKALRRGDRGPWESSKEERQGGLESAVRKGERRV